MPYWWQSAGPITKGWGVALLAGTILAALSGVGPLFHSAFAIALFDPSSYSDGQFFGPLLGLLGYPFVSGNTFNLLISLFLLFGFAGRYEQQWGSRDYLRFVLITYAGASLIAIPIMWGLQQAGRLDIASGPLFVVDALLIHMALVNPNGVISFFRIFEMQVKHFVMAFFAFELLQSIIDRQSQLGIFIGALCMGYFLTTGNWRLDKIRDQFRSGRRPDLRIVPKDQKPTLH